VNNEESFCEFKLNFSDKIIWNNLIDFLQIERRNLEKKSYDF